MRRWAIVILTVLAVLFVGAGTFFFWPASLPDVAEARARVPVGPETIKRGEYLARAADCGACHTLGSGKPYAGGLPFHLPMGTIYATNITPDKEAGIGNWSDAEFVRALHSGVRSDGAELYPAFPYTSYALMSTEDALAIKDYLFSQEPAQSRPLADDLVFPFNQRYIMRGWKLLFLPRGQQQPDPSKPADWNRGFYLVEALGHCGECHTPRNILYGLDQGKKFSGAIAAGWKAYNITSNKEEGTGAWSDEQIADYLSKGHGQNRGAASGSMAEAVEFSLRYLTPGDVHSMVAYLRTIPPQNTHSEGVVELDPPAVRNSTAYMPPLDETRAETLGLGIFQGACASCHGWNGEGLQHPQAALIGSQTVNDPAATNLMQVLIHGSHLRTTKDGNVFMPAFSAYTDDELAAVTNYVISHFGAKLSRIKPSDVAAARKLQ